MTQKPIEDIYPLSPMQQGMLFHTLYAPTSDVYVSQMHCTLHEPIDIAAFERAWQRVVDRHPILRTIFLWEKRDEPLQVVRRAARLAWIHHDWRDAAPDQQHARLQAFLVSNRAAGFALNKAPLMRPALIRLSEASYEFVLCHHHLLLDAWSLPILLREAFAFYRAFSAGRELELERSRPFGDYIDWLGKQDLAQAETFWRGLLGGLRAPTGFGLPPPPDAPAAHDPYDDEDSLLDAQTTAALQQAAREHGITLSTIIQGAWALLLRRYSGDTDVVFGVTVSGRPQQLRGVESMVGVFINTLPMRVALPPAEPLASWLHGLQAQQVTIRRYEYSPLVQVQRWSDVPRGLPLFESIVIFENHPVDDSVTAEAGSMGITRLDAVERTNYPITMRAIPGRELSLRITYDQRRFAAASIRRMLGHLRTLLTRMAAAPTQPLGRFSLLTDDEARALLRDRNDTAVRWDGPALVHRLVEAQAAATPDAPAATFGTETISYAELNARANRLAHALRRRGITPEQRVGLYLERSLDLLVGLLAVLKAGAAYVPLDQAYPAQRLAFMVRDAELALLVTGGETGSGLAALEAALAPGGVLPPRLDLLADAAGIAACPGENPDGLCAPEQLAYVIYTSGSTGTPKGVAIPHGAVVNFLQSMARRLGITATDRLLALTTLAFDIAVLELLLPLAVGAHVVIAPRAVAQDPVRLAAAIDEAGITHMQATPASWRALVESGWPGRPLLAALCGGEALPPDLAQQLRRRVRALWNLYGPTETTVWSTCAAVEAAQAPVTIGGPIDNTTIYVLDSDLQPVPVGVPGDLYIGGDGLARGYLGRPDQTAERFVPNPFGVGGAGDWGLPAGEYQEPRTKNQELGSDNSKLKTQNSKLYKTGDLARWREDGLLEFLGRADHQVKLRGYRIELGEIESALAQHPAVRAAVVVPREERADDVRLVAYAVLADGQTLALQEARAFLAQRLPDYMLPGALVALDALPLTPNGKVDRRALPAPLQALPGQSGTTRTALEQQIAQVWREVLGVEQIDVQANFFDQGGHSLLMMRVYNRLREVLDQDISMMDLFQHPTVASLAAALGQRQRDAQSLQTAAELAQQQRTALGRGGEAGAVEGIAIVGMAGRFPQSPDLDTFWRHLCDGTELITPFSDDVLLAAGVERAVLEAPGYVKAGTVVDGIEMFDGPFFGFSAREAEITDPQQRVFLECAWEALEHAGYAAGESARAVGVYAGMSMSTYMEALFLGGGHVGAADGFQIGIGNDKDHLATRVAYKLNLRGPAVAVQTACSTSLVAIVMACQGLLTRQCQMALAGGVALNVPQTAGYWYQEGGIFSPDGHCRAFDAQAQGTVAGNGAGVVVLKRLADALDDGDTIHAVIRGFAVNNDGALKAGYTAPSVEGQAEVVRIAQMVGGIDPRTIGYVEAHGTGTPLGDPIEVAALTRAFGAQTQERGFCAIGSVKTNMGHLFAAAGVAGVIKTAMALRHGQLPPSLHFHTPNPQIDFAQTPFYVNTALAPWPASSAPRRAGVSSFGIGGTNAHLILEEAPAPPPPAPARPSELLVLSARSPAALAAAAERLAQHLQAHPALPLADVASTLQTGRRAFAHRLAFVCRTTAEAIAILRDPASPHRRVSAVEPQHRTVAWLFPGQGAQHIGMGADLYAQEPAFRDALDRCAALLQPLLGLDIRTLIFQEPEAESTKDTKDTNGSGHQSQEPRTKNQEPTSKADGLRLEAWQHNPAEAD
ncbi:MAG TPA: amino acid adenylation domain-containing protein, partial [Roseiflexaceae bacterium]|nr:amino acid adenylation domain-containing protein [Roseiflexaceae bacterium]